MIFGVFFISAPLSALVSLPGYAQTEPHPGAEKALERIVLERDFGENLRFQSQEVIITAENPKVPGPNGRIFMRWKGAAPTMEVVASEHWFEDTGEPGLVSTTAIEPKRRLARMVHLTRKLDSDSVVLLNER